MAYRQEWLFVEFYGVGVPNLFLKTLHQALLVNPPVINTVRLGWHMNLENSQQHYIAEMVISCKTKVLEISSSFEVASTDWMIQMLSCESCVLEELKISENNNFQSSL